MAQDISKNTLFVLVVLTLLISVLGTWTVLSQINAGPAPVAPADRPVDSGKVSLTIGEPPTPVVDTATGYVAFEIEAPGR